MKDSFKFKKIVKNLFENKIYLIIGFFLIFLNLIIYFTPIIALRNENIANKIYWVFSPTCHQLTQRSYCIFQGELLPRNCLEDGSNILSKQNQVIDFKNLKVGYKMPVCSRCFAFYFSILFFWFLIPFIRKNWFEMPSLILFFIFIIPMGFDGFSQLFAIRQTTNFLRIITGFLSGIVIPLFLLPIIFSNFHKENRKV